MKTIYEYFSNYSEQEIDYVISSLSQKDKLLLEARYGNDLHKPKRSKKWSYIYSEQFYCVLIPKVEKMLLENFKTSVDNSFQANDTINTYKINNDFYVDNYYTQKLMQLLNVGKSNNEICDILNIHPSKLYEELLKLKIRGISYLKEYYSDGSIKYKTGLTIQDLKKYESNFEYKTINMDDKENNIKLLLISDLHFGNKLERLDLLDRAYNYCIKHGINIILCSGDFLDGSFSRGEQKISNLYQQVEYFIRNYPYDKNILTFGVCGDHDLSILEKTSLNIMEVCENFRHDIIIGGYNNARIKFKKDYIHLFHRIRYGKFQSFANEPIILRGHSHRYLTWINNGKLNINLPTLSNIMQYIPSVIELDLSFVKEHISDAIVKHICFGVSDIILGENRFNLQNLENNPQKSLTR